jgi:hypothetical protein
VGKGVSFAASKAGYNIVGMLYFWVDYPTN